MSAANRRRGADAERAVVAWLREHGWPDARRYLAGDSRQPGDIDAIPGVCIEVKDVAASASPAAPTPTPSTGPSPSTKPTTASPPS